MKNFKSLFLLFLMSYSFSETTLKANIPFTILSGSIEGIATHSLEMNECADGGITLDVDNPNGPFYYQWSTGADTKDITGLSPGKYCVTVTDDLCGEAIGCWEVRCCPFLLELEDVEYEAIHPACEGGDGGVAINITSVANEEFPLKVYLESLTDHKQYDIDLVSANSVISDLPVGEYSSQIIYGEGCSFSFPFEVEVKALEIQFEVTPSCDNDGSIEANVYNGIGDYGYSWTDDPTETTFIRTGLGSNLYTLVVTDNLGCTESASVFIKDLDPIVIEDMAFSLFEASCNSNDGAFSIDTPPSGGLPPFTYECSNGATGSVSETNWTPIYNFSPGMHSITITDVVGCTASQEFEIPSNEIPPLIVQSLEHTCEGQENGLIGLGYSNHSIAWSNGQTGNIISDLAAGFYTYVATDADGCTVESTLEVEALNAQTNPLQISGTVYNSCESQGSNNGKISLDIQGGVDPIDIIWSNGDDKSVIQNLGPGNYSATITDKCGQEAFYSGTVISDQVEIDLDVSFPNFEETLIVSDVNGGSQPYDYQWSTGDGQFFLYVEEEGTYSVTVSDANGCSKSESVDIYCEPSNFTYISVSHCASPFKLKFQTNQGIGPGPYLIKVEKKINQEYVLVDYQIIQSSQDIPDYQYSDDDAGYFRVTTTNHCGKSQTDIFNSCVDCDYYYYNEGDKYFVNAISDMLNFELECPCTDDCGFLGLGLTTDKVKLKLNQTELTNFANSVGSFPSFKIVWPEGPETTVHYNGNEDKFVTSGPTEYVLSTVEFNAGGITAEVSMSLPFGIGEVCNLNIPFDFGKQGYNGWFYKWTEANPFSNFEPPYNWGSSACLFECTVPHVTGELYKNEPIDYYDMLENYDSQCAENNDENTSGTNFYLYEPNNYLKPCEEGGRVISHVETPIGLITGELEIPANVAIDEHIGWVGSMIEDNDYIVPFTCPGDELEKGYCLFNSEDVYGEGVILRDPLIMSYCEGRFYDPPVDTDGDGIPDVEDPCPLDPDVFCDGNDDDNDGGPSGGNTDANGCTTNFRADECQLIIVCPGEEPTYVEGVVSTESHSGIHPCIYCFTADVCRVVHPETGEEYAEIVGPITSSVGVETIDTDSLTCPEICAISFTCNGDPLHVICAPGCTTINDPVCGFSDLYSVISFSQEEDSPQAIEVEIDREFANDIVSRSSTDKKASEVATKLSTMPNPSGDDFLVVFDSDSIFTTKLKVKTIVGSTILQKEVKVKKGYNEFIINEPLMPGIYTISVEMGNTIKSTKHVVQK